MTNREYAELIWKNYERYLSPLTSSVYNGPAALDKECFLDTVEGIIRRSNAEAISCVLDDALNSGDGSYRP